MAKRDIITALNAVPQGGAPQHPFDLSAGTDFHHKGGQYEVVAVRDTVPNGTYEVGVDAFTRSILCNTANFCHIKENYYFIHVPLGLISRNAYQMLVDRKQPYSSLDMGIEQFPTFSLSAVVQRLLEITQLDVTLPQNAKFADIHGFNIAYGAFRLFDMLGFGYYGDIVHLLDGNSITMEMAKGFVQALVNGKRPTALRLAAYQCTWYHFFRNDIYDNDVSARCFNFDDITYTTGSTVDYDILHTRDIDDFIVECCQLRYVPYKKDLFTGSMPGTQYGPVSSVPIDVQFDGLSAEFVGTPVTPTFTGQSSQITGEVGVPLNANGNPWTPVIESDYGKWEFEDVPSNMFSRNAGQFLDNDPLQGNQAEVYNFTDNGDNTFDIHDGALETKGGGKAYHNHQILEINASHVHKQHGSITPRGTVSAITPTGRVDLSGTAATATSLFDVLQLVESQAIQKWRQKSMLAGNKTADQFRAHHGVVPRHLIDHLPDFIGSVDNEINVTEITSQADTATSADESNLGEIRGRGYGASDARTFKFHSDDYGILLVLHAIVPENTYNSFGIEIGNTMRNYTDFYQTEFQNIGLQAVPKYLIAPATDGDTPSSPSQEGGDTFNSSNGVIGYAPRYFGYKSYQSKVHGMFNPSRFIGYEDSPLSVFGYADMQSFVMPRRDMLSGFKWVEGTGSVQFGLDMSLTNLYVNPSIFDSIFAVAADDSEVTDTFFSHCYVICRASQPMSVLGLPQF